ncbi:MAG: ATPase [Steroidobacteraceae bacterium]
MILDKILAFAGLFGLLQFPVEHAAAEVLGAAANGFEVRETVHVAAAPDKAYAALLLPGRWWSPDHSFSHNTANFVLDARAGGCWCENLPDGGSAEFMRVVYAAPGKVLRLRGALGPLQGMGVEGAMTWSLKSSGNGTDISVSYAVGGFAKDGLDDLSKVVDRVLGEQIERLKKFIDG